MHKSHHRFFTLNIGLALLALCGGIATAADAPPVSGYSRWFDASKLVGLPDGASVTTCSDLSGNGANAAVPTGNAAPTFVANAGTGTGLGALYFPKNTGPSNSGALRFTRDSSIRTVFSVFKGNSFLLTDASTYHFHRPSDDSPTAPLWEAANGWASANIRNGSTCVNGIPVDGTSFAMPTNAYNGFNLVEVVTTGPVSADSFNKDRVYHAGNQYQAEVIIYDRALSDAERLQVRNYLTAKWFGFDASTPPVVTGTVPAAGGSIDPVAPSVSLSFNKLMTRAAVEAAFSMDGLNGSFSWVENTLTFKPALRLRPNTTYTVSIGTGAQAFDGTSLAAPYSFVVSTPSGLVGSALTVTCDNAYELYLNGILVGSGNTWTSAQKYSNIALVPGKNVIAVKGVDAGGVAALLAEMTVNGRRVGTSRDWKVTLTPPANWANPTLDDTSWASATEYGAYGVAPWNKSVSNMPTDTPARWIWSSNNNADNTVYLRWTVDTSAVSSAPTNLTFSHIADRVVAFTWQPAVGANPSDYYEVYRNGAFIAVAGTPSYRDTTLTPLTQYRYAVRSVNALGGTSPFSAPAVATTLSAPPIGTGTGLQGKYYASKDLTNRILVRTDAQVAFDWGNGAPATGVGADNFSVRWEGQIQSKYSEQYTFYTLSDDGVRLWVDGQLLVSDWNTHAPMENKGLITLQAGQKYDIRMEYFESTGGAVAKLFWESASQLKELVPTSQLYPAVLAEVNLITSAESSVSPAWVEGRNVSDAVSVKFSVNGGAAQDVVRESAIQWYADTASAQGLPYGIPLDKDAATALSVTSLAASTQAYYYRVRATNSAGDSVYSNEATATGQVAAALSPVGPPGYIYCASENQTFTLPGTCDVAYGANGKFNYLTGLSGTITFNNATFGDPIVGTVKAGFYKPAADLPAAPSNLCATVVSVNQINLTWTDNASNETGFKLERKLGATGTWAQIATLDANAATYSDAANGCGTTQTQNYSLVWTPTKLNGKSWSEDEIVIRVNDSLLFTVESGIPDIQVKVDANGDGTVEYSGPANMKFPWKYNAAGHYVVTAWIGTEKCGSLTVTVVDANLHAPIACEVGYQREKFIEVTPLDSAAKVSFVGNDPSLLGVSVKGPAVDEGISGLKLYMTAVKRGTPILQARVNGKCGPLVKQQEVDEFTLELPAAEHLVAFAVEGGAVGTSTITIRPYIPNLRLQAQMFAHRSTFDGGVTTISVNTNELERVYDDATGEEIGRYQYRIEQPDGEQSYCIHWDVFQASSEEIKVAHGNNVNGNSCVWIVEEVTVPVGGIGTLPAIVKTEGKPPRPHTFTVQVEKGLIAPQLTGCVTEGCTANNHLNATVDASSANAGKYHIRIDDSPSPNPVITVVGIDHIIWTSWDDGNYEGKTIYVPVGGAAELRATPDPADAAWPSGYPEWSTGVVSETINVDTSAAGTFTYAVSCGTSSKSVTVEVVQVVSLAVPGADYISENEFATPIQRSGDVVITAVTYPDITEAAASLPMNFITWTGGVDGGDQFHHKVTKTVAEKTDMTATCGTSSASATVDVVKVINLTAKGADYISENEFATPIIEGSGDVIITAVTYPDVSGAASSLPSNFITWTGGTDGDDQLHHKVTKTVAAKTEVTATCGTSSASATIDVVEVVRLEVADAAAISEHEYVTLASKGDVTITAVLNPDISSYTLPEDLVAWTCSAGRAGDGHLEWLVSKAHPVKADIKAACGYTEAHATVYVMKLEMAVPTRIPPRVNTAIPIKIEPDGVTITFAVQNTGGANGDATFADGGNTLDSTGTLNLTTPNAPTGATDPSQTRPGNAGNLTVVASVDTIELARSSGFTVAAQPVNFVQTQAMDIGSGYLRFVYTWGSDSGQVVDLDQVWIGEYVTYSDGGVHVGAGRPWRGNNPEPTITPPRPNGTGRFGTFTDTHTLPGGLPTPGPSDSFTATQFYGFHDLRTDATPADNTLEWQTNLTDAIIMTKTVFPGPGGAWFFSTSKSGTTATTLLPP